MPKAETLDKFPLSDEGHCPCTFENMLGDGNGMEFHHELLEAGAERSRFPK